MHRSERLLVQGNRLLTLLTSLCMMSEATGLARWGRRARLASSEGEDVDNKAKGITRWFACIELGVMPAEHGVILAVFTIPGREGTITHRVRCAHGVPSPAQLEDLVGQIDAYCREAVLTFCGVQQVLPVAPLETGGDS
jgi:hypothetical protein